jgi:hypothetical protein
VALPRAGIVIADTHIKRLLTLTWWAIGPPCALLVARFSYERGCLDPYELLRPIMLRQTGALLVAGVYVAAHVWLITAAILTARARDAALPWTSALRTAWGPDLWKVVAMAVVLAVEQVPRAVWAWIYRAVGVC